MRRVVAALLALGCLSAVPAAAAQQQFDREREESNYAKSAERERYESGTAEYAALQSRVGQRRRAGLVQMLARDPERAPTNVCGAVFQEDACVGDARLHDFGPDHGIVQPVLFTARSGATLSGHVWATRDGPAKRPGVVFVTGSVQVPEPAYWFAPVVLAKRGYVVLTFDEQGEGLSDTLGESPDTLEGVPAQSGRPFFDGAEDALDFFLSKPERPYVPRPSCTSGTVHSAKQERRVKAGLNAAHNPLWEMLDPERIGLSGQSFGAQGASYVGQADPRVDAVVAFDNLRGEADGLEPVSDCKSAPETRQPVKPRVPSLGISNDYFIVPTRYTANPGTLAKNSGTTEFSEAGVDTAQINIRGGTHLECAYVPLAGIRATLRGYQLCGWYLAAWFDKYLRDDPTADRRLLTTRWHTDARDREIDPAGEGNLHSFYFPSRVDVAASSGGGRVRCEHIRAGDCRWLTSQDAWRGGFDIVGLANSPDGDGGPTAYEPKLRDGRVPVAVRSTLRAAARSAGRVFVGARATGTEADSVVRFELQVRRGRRWAGVRRRLVPGRRVALRLRPGARRRYRVRAIDRLGGGGPWSRSVLVRARR